ncbi:glyoxal oxidase [Scleroderma citrinum Foug A]|uniref:Glyoxal oxidase n=1 Tax=Scleroderma citrinum Foug A TaxID=1036808 RepID=A0A0C3AE56_9AGAM|nr:glyoxal oxidase [Scleroderma citrinum Foug A]
MAVLFLVYPVLSQIVYATAQSVATIQTTGLPGQWKYQGCLNEPSGQTVFRYEIDQTNNNTVDACLNQCAAFGYPAAGLEDGSKCLCGDITDVAANGHYVADSQCNMPCSGDLTHLCGADNLLTTYYWNGTMNVWHTPSNAGYYQFLMGGVVVPLMATVGINNKVTFLEKKGTEGFSEFTNSTGAYELDLSLANDFGRAWREMHVKSDIFCSASIVLPDKGARQINVAGWSNQANYGVRFYTPDGSPGVNGTNDWEENYNEISLQRSRWYTTAMLMPNGSILVAGGKAEGNSAQSNLEILPRPSSGDTVVTLDFLQRTYPNNLYPSLMVLPSGRFFIGYYNEARILDPVTFDTVTVLPNMPGAVNNSLAGRTYPLEGSAVLLPQHAPYSDPIEILVCGGSTPEAVALDNCISIAPEATNPTWTLERMPSKRVLPCMVTLPDGTYMILNGAQQGVAGFGTAFGPNLNAVLYDPSQPVGQRMSILNSTTIARMYHSEATLLPDGRVLISGSDSLTRYPNGSYVYPEELRLEVYIPPYLSQGLQQPQFTISETDWAYSGEYSIVVTLFQGTTSNMRVSLVAASSSTHGNVMSGGRIIFPEFTCAGNTCTIAAPPNAFVSPPGWHQLFILDGPTPSHSAWVRVGGDPAQLGNWPNFPDFTRPGV